MRITAGTLGGFFRDKDGDLVMLSNQHVLAGSNAAKAGERIIQPGRYDGGKSRHRFARLKSFVPLKNGVNQDSAIAIVEKPFRNYINFGGVPKGFRAPKVGMKVKKSGRTTKITSGKIIAVNGTFSVNYGNTSYTIKNCVVSTFMSKGGDSGSLLMDKRNKICGLLFAGSSSLTIYNDIGNVVKQYGLKLP